MTAACSMLRSCLYSPIQNKFYRISKHPYISSYMEVIYQNSKYTNTNIQVRLHHRCSHSRASRAPAYYLWFANDGDDVLQNNSIFLMVRPHLDVYARVYFLSNIWNKNEHTNTNTPSEVAPLFCRVLYIAIDYICDIIFSYIREVRSQLLFMTYLRYFNLNLPLLI